MTRRREEAGYQRAVEELLALRRWRWMHMWSAQHSSGQTTGFPDVLAVRGARLIAIEIKTMRGRVSKPQEEWRQALLVAGVDARIVRLPRDWHVVEEMTR